MADACSLHCSLKFRDGKKWKQRSCVLRKLSPVADCLHLSLRKEGEGFGRTSFVGSLRANSTATSDDANLPLDDYFGVDTGFELDREKHVMAIICRRRVFTLAFHNQETLNSWKTFVCSQLGDGKCFQVSMVKASGAQFRPHLGQVNLFVRGRTLCIATRGGQLAGPPVYLASWSVSRLRRFGVQAGLFCFDAGDPGEFAGVFAFASPVATEIDSELKQSAVSQLMDRQGSFSDVKPSVTEHRPPTSLDSATTPNFTPPANESQQMYHNFPLLTNGLPTGAGRSAAAVPISSDPVGIPPSSGDMMYYNIPPAGGRNTDIKTPCDSPIVISRSPGGATQQPTTSACKSSSQSIVTPRNSAMRRVESLENSEFAAATQQLKRGLSTDERRNNRFHLRRHSLGDIYRKIQAAMSDGLSLPRGLGWTSSSSKLSTTAGDVDSGLTLDSVPNPGRDVTGLSTPKSSLDRSHASVHKDTRANLSTGSVTSPLMMSSRSPAKMVPCNAPPTPPPRCHIRTKHNAPLGRTSSNSEDGYIDVRPFTSSRRSRAHGDGAESFSTDFTPLIDINSTAAAGRRVVKPPTVLDSDIDGAFRPGSDPDLTDENSSLLRKDGEFRPRSFSIGSQLSAAATSVHEESCPDLVAALETTGIETELQRVAKDREAVAKDQTAVAKVHVAKDMKYTEPTYMLMVGHSVSSSVSKSTAPSHHSSHPTVVKSPSFGVISTSSRPLAASRPKSACPLPTRHSDAGLLSLPTARETLIDNEDSGYLMFSCGGGNASGLPACGDQSAESSLERLGPPPAVPHSTNADTEYMNLANCSSMSDCPPLPPKMSSNGAADGTRKKAMLSLVTEEESVQCRGKRMEKVTPDGPEVAAVSGAVQQRSPLVPPRQDLTAQQQQQRSSVISRRPAARCGKPDLTVDIINSPPSSGPVTRQFSAVHPASAPRLLADLNTRHSLPPTPASAFSIHPRGNNDSANTSGSSQRSTSQAITTLRPRNGCEYLRINRRRLASASLGDGSPLPSATPRSPSSKSLTVFNFDALELAPGVVGGESPRRSHSSRHRPPPPPVDASTPNQPQTIALDEVLAPPLPPSPKINYTDLDLADVPSSSPPVVSRSTRGVGVAPALQPVTEYAQIDFEATSAAAQAGRAHVQSREVCLERQHGRPSVSRAGSIVAATAAP